MRGIIILGSGGKFFCTNTDFTDLYFSDSTSDIDSVSTLKIEKIGSLLLIETGDIFKWMNSYKLAHENQSIAFDKYKLVSITAI